MSTKIKLSLWNSRGAVASLEKDDESINIALNTNSRSAKVICKRAAKRLRQLAEKFEALADTDEPFKAVTQSRINRNTA